MKIASLNDLFMGPSSIESEAQMVSCSLSRFMDKHHNPEMLKYIPKDEPIDYESIYRYLVHRKYGFSWKHIKNCPLQSKDYEVLCAVEVSFSKKQKMIIVHAFNKKKQQMEHKYY